MSGTEWKNLPRSQTRKRVRGMSNMIKITEQIHGRIRNQSFIKPLLLTIIVIFLIFYSRRFQTL